jgi:hypothetical protein
VQFLTVSTPKDGEHNIRRNFGGRHFYGPFRFGLSPDPSAEVVAIDAEADDRSRNFWAVNLFLPDIAAGVEAGGRDITKFNDRFCCVRLTVRDQGYNDVDTGPEAMQKEGWAFMFGTLQSYADPVPPLHPDWLTSDVVALARGIHASGTPDGLPALTDALLEAGCDHPLALEHLRTCPDHGTSCWVVEMICAQAAARDGG